MLYLDKFIGTILVVLSLVFLGLQFQELEIEASGVKALALVLLTVLYSIQVKQKHRFFYLFLVTYTIAELINYITWIENFDLHSGIDYFYYLGNGLYILSYCFLIIRILSELNIKEVCTRFAFQSILLFVLGVFFVYIVTDIVNDEFNFNEHFIELLYNAVVMALMCLALLNYMYRDDKKSMNFLIGSIFIVFSEVIQLAYYYIASFAVLNVLCSVFLVFAFVFFYIQSKLSHRKKAAYISQDISI